MRLSRWWRLPTDDREIPRICTHVCLHFQYVQVIQVSEIWINIIFEVQIIIRTDIRRNYILWNIVLWVITLICKSTKEKYFIASQSETVAFEKRNIYLIKN